ncbi:hypothetical protein GHT06_012407 [Daphnia sinensis]|uniref:Protein kinase domain-containing protein n=1 Tax=Daphnia sinensis TaxID=1820382 RepID=A0AAD5PZS4_9CRUS|nr:hypothetical protein GHT06_012407 [Daphnia sinensis]
MESYKEIGDTGISYSKNDVLGKGTYGDVYRGIFNGENVAVKKVLLNRSEKEEREVNLQTRLDHTNVLAILKVAEDDDFRYIVLELCAGTLEEVINKTFVGPILPPDQVVLYEIADGLDYIHSQKLVHRDIKPENILISKSGQMKLSDFGLSKQISTRDTCSMSGIKGTLLWMAPELRGNNEPNKATPKCDVFPCGCVFFVFLTRENGGIHPFGVTNDHLIIQINIREGKPVNMDELKPDHFAAAVIRQMLESDPLIRTSMEEVKRSLGKLLPNSLIPNVNMGTTTVQKQQKKIYDRQFLLEIRNKMGNEKPEGLPNLEIVCDRPRKVRLAGSIRGRPTQGSNQFSGHPNIQGSQNITGAPIVGSAPEASSSYETMPPPMLAVKLRDNLKKSIQPPQQDLEIPQGLQLLKLPPTQQKQPPPQFLLDRQPVAKPHESLVSRQLRTPAIHLMGSGIVLGPSLFSLDRKPVANPRKSQVSRRPRTSALRLVDPNTNRDVLTGEEMPPSAPVPPTTTTFPEITTRGAGDAAVGQL